MKRLKRTVGYFLIAVFFSIALSGCGKTTPDPKASQIVVWSFEDKDVWTPIKKQFEKTNKGITLIYAKQVFDSSYESRVLNSILSGNGPDVWSMPNDWVYRHKDKLVPRPSTTPIDLDKSFVPAVKQSVYFDKNIYALAPSAQPLIAYYNPTMFSKTLNAYEETHQSKADVNNRKTAETALGNGLPTSWTDFATATQLLTQRSGETITQAGVAMGTDQISSSQDLLYLLMLQNGTKVIADDLKLATFNLPATTPKSTTDTPGKLALDFYTSFANPASPNYSWNSSLGNDIDAFGTGKVAIIFGYDSLQNTLAQKYPNLSYRKGAVPQLTTDSTKFIDYAKFNVFSVSNLSLNPAVSWNLIDSLNGENNSDFNSATRLYTSLKATSYDISMANRQTGNPEKNSLVSAQTIIKGRYPVEFDNAINAMIFAVNHSIQTPQNALDLTANNLTDNYLRKAGW